jgi:transposase-like protein
MEYSEVMKARMIKRMTGPRAVTATALAEETGISQPTLSRWLRDAGTLLPVSKSRTKVTSVNSKTPKRTQDWTMLEKLRVVIEAAELPEEELGAFLRREGLHREQFEQWRTATAEALGVSQGRRRQKSGPSPEQKRINELERELRRKDKALAETTALLVLKKKFEALFGDEEDDT